MHGHRRHLFLIGCGAALSAAPALAADDPEGEDDDGDVTVEGRRARLDESAAAVTAIEVDERLPESADVGDAVARSPGATVRRLGGLGGFSAVSLRGSALRQVEIHLDGIPLNPDGSASVNLGELPLRSFQRVEVWRGGGPAWAAATPMGGIVNLVTRDAGGAPPSLNVGFGSWGSLTGGASAAVVSGRTDVLATVGGLRTAGDFVYFDDNGTDGVRTDDARPRRADNDKTQLNALVRVRHRLDRGTATGLVVATLRDEGLPGPIGASSDGRLATGWTMGAADRELAIGATRLRARVWGQVRDERLQPPRTTGLPVSVERQGRVGVHGEVRHALTDVLVVGGTARVRHDLRTQPGTPSAARPASRWTGTAAVDASVRLSDALRIEPVLHGQAWVDQGDGDRTSRALTSPRLTAFWSRSEALVLRAGVGRAARPPDFLELFGDRGAVVGRTDLRPERGTWADVGLRGTTDARNRVTWELGAFTHHAVDRIVFVQNGQRTLVPVNIGRSTVSGVELGVDVDVLGWLDARLAGTLNQSMVRNDDVPGLDRKALPRVPVGSLNADIGVRLGDRVRLAWQHDLVGSNAWDEANRTIAAPRQLASVAVRAQPSPDWPSVSFEIRNLLNTLVQPMPLEPSRPSRDRVLRPITDFAGYPLPGRTVLVTLRWTLDESGS